MNFDIPDAPYIREAEQRGTDYMYEYSFGYAEESEEDDDRDT